MHRNARPTERRSMRISVQKFLEQNGAAQPQRRDEPRRDCAAAGAAAPAFWPVPADDNEAGPSGNRDNRNGGPILRKVISRKPKSAPVDAAAAPIEQAAAPAQQVPDDIAEPGPPVEQVPAAAPVEEVPAPAPPRGRRANPPRGPRNEMAGHNNGRRPPQRNRPAPAPVAAPRQVEVVVPRNEAARDENNRNEHEEAGDNALVFPEIRPVRWNGPGHNRRFLAKYHVRLTERILPHKDVQMAKRLAITIPGDDFHLIADSGECFPCSKELLQSMCCCLNFSDRWDVHRLTLPCDADSVISIIDFASSGMIILKNDDSVINIIAAADFLGFESLLRVCVAHVAGPNFPAKFIIEVHSRLSHIERIPAIFLQKLSDLPVKVFNARSAAPQALLTSLNIGQMQQLLQNDNLLVANEDQAVMFAVQWLAGQNFESELRKADLEDLCFKNIRYPFITRGLQKMLKDNTLNLTREIIVDDDCLESCQPRSGYEKHIHILWKEFRNSKRGAEAIGLSCITWNKNTRTLQEKQLASIPHETLPYEEHRSAQFTVAGNKIVKVTTNRAHNRIYASEVDIKQATTTKRSEIILSNEYMVERPDLIVLKGTQDLTIGYYESRAEIRSYNPDTWESKQFPSQPLRGYPMYPFEWGFFGDCAVGINSGRVVISEVDFSSPVEIDLPYNDGRFIDMERVGDELFILTDNASRRVVDANAADEILVINIKDRQLVRTMTLPLYSEDPEMSKKAYDASPDPTLRFVRIEGELFVVTQRDRDMPLRLVSFDLKTYTTEVVAVVKAPQPDVDDPQSVHARIYLCAVPLRVVACDKTPLRDQVNVSRQ